MQGRHHPTRHLLYAFLIGAALTALGFGLALLDQRSAERMRNDATLIVAGSETLRPWFTACGQDFMDKRRDIDVVVRGGGTSTGIAALVAGQIDLVYVAPERLMTERCLNLFQDSKIALFAIDEAHCVSQWGHDFRPEYIRLSVLHEQFPDVPRIALTATADPQTRAEIVHRLQLGDAAQFVSSPE